MVEILGHVSEGFIAEITLMKGVCSVGLPTRNPEKEIEITRS